MVGRAVSLLAVSLLAGLALGGTPGCSGPAPKTSTIRHDDGPAQFEDLAVFVANNVFRMDPAEGVAMGIHKYDGVLPELTPAGIADQIKLLDRDRDALLRFDAARMSPRHQLERDVLLAELRKRRFALVDLDVYRTNPMSYTGNINLDAVHHP